MKVEGKQATSPSLATRPRPEARHEAAVIVVLVVVEQVAGVGSHGDTVAVAVGGVDDEAIDRRRKRMRVPHEGEKALRGVVERGGEVHAARRRQKTTAPRARSGAKETRMCEREKKMRIRAGVRKIMIGRGRNGIVGRKEGTINRRTHGIIRRGRVMIGRIRPKMGIGATPVGVVTSTGSGDENVYTYT